MLPSRCALLQGRENLLLQTRRWEAGTGPAVLEGALGGGVEGSSGAACRPGRFSLAEPWGGRREEGAGRRARLRETAQGARAGGAWCVYAHTATAPRDAGALEGSDQWRHLAGRTAHREVRWAGQRPLSPLPGAATRNAGSVFVRGAPLCFCCPSWRQGRRNR